MPPWLKQQGVEIWGEMRTHLPTIAAAIAILIVGWIAALVVRRMIYSLLKKTTIDDRIAAFMGFETGGEFGSRVERIIASTIYYMMIGAVLVVFFSVLRIDAVMQPLLTVGNRLGAAVPNIMKAALIGVAGLVVAHGLRALVRRTLTAMRFDERFASLERDDEKPAEVVEEAKEVKKEAKEVKEAKRAKADKKAAKPDKGAADQQPLSTLVANMAFWFVIIVTATPVLEALDIQVLSKPLQVAFERITEYLPKVGGAAIIMVIGYVGARLLRRVVTSLLTQIGVDRAVDRLGVGRILGGYALSRIAGALAMAFVLLHAAISAVDKLDIAAISGPASEILRQVYAYLPKLFISALLMAIGAALAKVIGNVVARLAAAIGLDAFVRQLGIVRPHEELPPEAPKVGESDPAHEPDELDGLFAARRDIKNPSDVLGVLVGAVVVLLFAKQVLLTLELAGLAQMFDRVLAFLPQVLVAAVLIGAGMWAGRWAKQRIDEMTRLSTDRVMRSLGTVARVAIGAVAAMMALQQLGVGEQLITVAFAVILGSTGLAAALAFGLGGREVAGRVLEREVEKRR